MLMVLYNLHFTSWENVISSRMIIPNVITLQVTYGQGLKAVMCDLGFSRNRFRGSEKQNKFDRDS